MASISQAELANRCQQVSCLLQQCLDSEYAEIDDIPLLCRMNDVINFIKDGVYIDAAFNDIRAKLWQQLPPGQLPSASEFMTPNRIEFQGAVTPSPQE